MFDLFEDSTSTAWLDEMLADVKRTADGQNPSRHIITSMSELAKHPEALAVSDAAELAFWGVEFVECDDVFLPEREDEERSVFNARMREKEGHDYWRGCRVTVTQLQCSAYDEGKWQDIDMIFAAWHDGLQAAVDTTDLHTEQRTSEDEDTEPQDEYDDRALRTYIKRALAQLTDLGI